MSTVADILLSILRDAWMVLAGLLGALVALALLAQALRAASANAVGAAYWTQAALASGVGVLFLVLFAFLGVPAIFNAVKSAVVYGGLCRGISAELSAILSSIGQFAVQVIGGLAAVRMLRAVVVTAAYAAAGGSASLAEALVETGEIILGMALASAILPIVQRLLC